MRGECADGTCPSALPGVTTIPASSSRYRAYTLSTVVEFDAMDAARHRCKAPKPTPHPYHAFSKKNIGVQTSLGTARCLSLTCFLSIPRCLSIPCCGNKTTSGSSKRRGSSRWSQHILQQHTRQHEGGRQSIMTSPVRVERRACGLSHQAMSNRYPGERRQGQDSAASHALHHCKAISKARQLL